MAMGHRAAFNVDDLFRKPELASNTMATAAKASLISARSAVALFAHPSN
jgi:hypothetical protein